jgi:hypothetical protein
MNPKDQRVLVPFHKMLGGPVVPVREIRKIPLFDALSLSKKSTHALK